MEVGVAVAAVNGIGSMLARLDIGIAVGVTIIKSSVVVLVPRGRGKSVIPGGLVIGSAVVIMTLVVTSGSASHRGSCASPGSSSLLTQSAGFRFGCFAFALGRLALGLGRFALLFGLALELFVPGPGLGLGVLTLAAGARLAGDRFAHDDEPQPEEEHHRHARQDQLEWGKADRHIEQFNIDRFRRNPGVVGPEDQDGGDCDRNHHEE